MICGAQSSCVDLFLRLVAIGISNGAIIALNAIGVTLVYGAVRMINFAHGDLFALTTVVVTLVVLALGLSAASPPLVLLGGLVLALGAALVFGTLLNVAVERVAFRPFQGGSRIAPLIATIGVSFMLYQAALFARTLTNRVIPGEHRSVPGIPELPRVRIPELLPDLDLVRLAGLPLRTVYTLKDLLILLLAAILAALVGWFLQSTRAGRALRACAQDPEMAQLCGVNRNGAIRLAFGLGGALAGAAAFVFALYYTHPFTLYGAQSGLIAFAAAVLGGIGRPWGAFLSGLLFGVLSAFSDFFLATQWTPVLILLILILLLVFRPTGLVGEGDSGVGSAVGQIIAPYQGRRSSRRARWLAGAGVALALAYPAIDAALGLRQQVVVIGVLVFALLALGLNIILGFAGMLDLGYAACFAIGAYTAGILTSPGGALAGLVPGQFPLILLISGATAGLLGVINGALTLRLRGEYLAIVTLAFGQIVPQLVLNLDRWTGGTRGMSGLPGPRFFGYTLQTPLARYYLALGMVLLAALASQRLLRSRIGRAWAALSADEGAAMSCGVPAAQTRCLAFGLGNAIAGMAGALFASSFSYVDPTQSEFQISAMVLAMVVIGGAGSVPGAILGALLVAGYDQLAIPLLGAWVNQMRATEAGWLFAAFDVRSLNYLSFGLALYLTTLIRSRPAHP